MTIKARPRSSLCRRELRTVCSKCYTCGCDECFINEECCVCGADKVTRQIRMSKFYISLRYLDSTDVLSGRYIGYTNGWYYLDINYKLIGPWADKLMAEFHARDYGWWSEYVTEILRHYPEYQGE